MKGKETTLTRVYREDLQDIKFRFPKVTTADFFHMATRSNPFLQMEAALRKKTK